MALNEWKWLFVKTNWKISPLDRLSTKWESNLESPLLQIEINEKSRALYDILSNWDIFSVDFVSSEDELIITNINKIFEDDNQLIGYIINKYSWDEKWKDLLEKLIKIKKSFSVYWQIIGKKNKIFINFDLWDNNIIQVVTEDPDNLKNLKVWNFYNLNIWIEPSEFNWWKYVKWLPWCDFVIKWISNIYPTEKYINKSNLPNNSQSYFWWYRNISLREYWKEPLLTKDIAYKLIEKFFDAYWFTRVNSPKIVWSAIEWPVDAFSVDYFWTKWSLAISDILYQILAISWWFSRVYEIWPNFRQDPSKTKMHNSEYDCITFHGININSEYMINFINKLLQYLKENLETEWISTDPTIDIENIPVVEFSNIMEFLNENWYNFNIDNFHYIPLDAKSLIEKKYGRTIRIINQAAKQNPFYTKTFIDKNGYYLTKDCELWDTKITSIANWWERTIKKQEIIDRINERWFDLQNFEKFISLYENWLLPHWWLWMWVDRLLCFLTWIDDVKNFKLSPRAKGLKITL